MRTKKQFALELMTLSAVLGAAALGIVGVT